MKGDSHVVNCLEPHPSAPLTLATSGEDALRPVLSTLCAHTLPILLPDLVSAPRCCLAGIDDDIKIWTATAGGCTFDRLYAEQLMERNARDQGPFRE